ncbi:MAG: adenylate kinase [Synergistaceae bacterium]|nr:adenylate kinase [Synergistaceae bacterium]
MRVVLLGPPGAGKGTQAAKIKEKWDAAHVSTGDILRDNVKEGTQTGLLAKSYMDAGRLVPDDVMIDMIRSRLSRGDAAKGGFILDGFPRTPTQAAALDRILEEMGLRLDAAILLEVSDDEAVRRLSSRRVCQDCGAIYNIIARRTKEEGVCDVCGGSVIQRDDDQEGVIRDRLMVYRERTSPLIDYYADKGLLHRVDGTRSSDAAMLTLESIVAG